MSHTDHPPAKRASSGQAWAIAVLLFLQFMTGAVLVKVGIDSNNSADCLVQYNQAFATAYSARLKQSTASGEILDRIVQAVADQNRQALDSSVAEYVKQRDIAKSEQLKNPYPAFPSKYCAGDQP